MSEVNENQNPALTAGNTNANLAGTDRDEAAGQPSAADLDAAVEQGSVPVLDMLDPDADPLDEENTFDVNRAEFNELRDAFLRLLARVEKYNKGASHKI